MKNFDDAQRTRHEEKAKELGDRSFTFRSEDFHVRANVRYGVIKAVAGISENTDGNSVFEVIEDAVISLIDPTNNAAKRFRKVAAGEEFPVTFEDLIELLNWLIEEQTGRPPTPAESSSSGQTQNGTPSTEISSDALAAV